MPVLHERGHKIIGIWECPAILPKLRGYQVPFWYLRTFGPVSFSFLVLFALLARSRRSLLSLSDRCAADFPTLAHRNGAHYQQTDSPNDPQLIEWVRSNQIDILLTTVSFVLKKAIIEAPRLGCINKHAAALPCNRGLFPYFWARLYGTPQGVSYHQMVEKVDEGPLLHQRMDFDESHLKSMISFYLEVFSRFPQDIASAVDARLHDSYIEPRADLVPSYFGLPTRADYRRFRAVGGRVARLVDLKGALQLC